MRNYFYSTLWIFIVSACFLITGFVAQDAWAGGILDGKSFNINYTEYGKDGNPTKDKLIFKDGNFSSTDCEQYGFGPVMYEAITKDGNILFEATAKSEKEGIVEWEGKVQGDTITGNFMWSKPGQEPVFYTYSGSIKE